MKKKRKKRGGRERRKKQENNIQSGTSSIPKSSKPLQAAVICVYSF